MKPHRDENNAPRPSGPPIQSQHEQDEKNQANKPRKQRSMEHPHFEDLEFDFGEEFLEEVVNSNSSTYYSNDLREHGLMFSKRRRRNISVFQSFVN